MSRCGCIVKGKPMVDSKTLTDQQIKSAALRAIEEHDYDPAQVFTARDCKVFRADDDGRVMGQVWIMLPNEVLKEDADFYFADEKPKKAPKSRVRAVKPHVRPPAKF